MRKSKFTWQAAAARCLVVQSVNAVGRLRRRSEIRLRKYSTLAVNACPPVLVGVGIATSWKPPPCSREKPFCARLAAATKSKSGRAGSTPGRRTQPSGIGPQGLTGNSSVMGVHIESAPAIRQPSALLFLQAAGRIVGHTAGSCRSHL